MRWSLSSNPAGSDRAPAMHILGLSAYYHDSAAALVSDGEIIAAVQEERFSRIKHDARFPAQAIRSCLDQAGITLDDVEWVVFYDKPLLKFERLLETYLAYSPRGLRSFLTAMPVWLKEKLYLKAQLKNELAALAGCKQKNIRNLLFSAHHESHAASAFFPSPFQRAAVLCLDGVGEWATTSAWLGEDNSLRALWQIDFPHSLGLLYSAFTYHAGFRVNSGEYKLMGLAPYGEPKYVPVILERLIDLKADGSFRLNMDYFDFPTGLTMTNAAFDSLFGGPPRKPESSLGQREMDIAASIQAVTEEAVLRLGRSLHRETDCENICMAGGVALNCVANGRLSREGPFSGLWIQPAAGDAGGALGAALAVWHQHESAPRQCDGRDAMAGAYLGPAFTPAQVAARLDALGAVYRRYSKESLVAEVADILSQEKVVGWFQGRMEFGPRALGARSILADPRGENIQSLVNRRIKFRESFRPFAPSVLEERGGDWFDYDGTSPYMLLAVPLKESRRVPSGVDGQLQSGLGKLKIRRSEIPAVTHVDFSARLHTVNRQTSPDFHALLRAFETKTGCPVLLNTSFNVRGEPVVCSPEDAYRCFMRTRMDYLAIGDLLLAKTEQPVNGGSDDLPSFFEPD